MTDDKKIKTEFYHWHCNSKTRSSVCYDETCPNPDDPDKCTFSISKNCVVSCDCYFTMFMHYHHHCHDDINDSVCLGCKAVVCCGSEDCKFVVCRKRCRLPEGYFNRV